MRIKEKYNRSGYFWLPGKEERKIPGMLSITDGGKIELETLGLFEDSLKHLNENTKIDRIIGHVEKDGPVTIEDCFYTKKTFSFGDSNISRSKIIAHRVLCGVGYKQSLELKFNTFSFSVDCLDEWIGVSGINIDDDDASNKINISYTPPENINILLNNGMKLKVCFAYPPPSYPMLQEAKITQRAYFKLESEELCEINKFTSVAFKITNLMCFAMDTIVAIKNVSATSSEIYDSDEYGNKYPIPIIIYYQSLPYIENTPNKNRHDMLFNYTTIKDNIQQVFNNWIDAYKYLSPAFNLYFSTKNGSQKYIDSKFLSLAQGLETYHRRTQGGQLMESEIFESLVSTLLETCPDEHIEWLKGRLIHGNEINLRKRLKLIIEPFKKYLGTSKERSKLLKRIVDTRNYLTHYNENLENEYATGRDLWVLLLKMEVIFSLHFLNIIGFTTKEINNVVKNSYPLKQKIEEI